MPVSDFDIGLYYKFTRADNNNSFLVKRDADPPVLVSAGARWDVVDRSRRVSFVTWAGSDPYRMAVPILFDGWGTTDKGDDSVEDDIAQLNQMRVNNFKDYVPPPAIYVEGAVPVKGNKWVIESIDFGTNVIWDHDSSGPFRLRQDAVVNLLQFIEIDILQVKPATVTRTYHVQSGDTLKGISRKMYGTPKYYKDIQVANNIRDPKKISGVLRIPPIVDK